MQRARAPGMRHGAAPAGSPLPPPLAGLRAGAAPSSVLPPAPAFGPSGQRGSGRGGRRRAHGPPALACSPRRPPFESPSWPPRACVPGAHVSCRSVHPGSSGVACTAAACALGTCLTRRQPSVFVVFPSCGQDVDALNAGEGSQAAQGARTNTFPSAFTLKPKPTGRPGEGGECRRAHTPPESDPGQRVVYVRVHGKPAREPVPSQMGAPRVPASAREINGGRQDGYTALLKGCLYPGPREQCPGVKREP